MIYTSFNLLYILLYYYVCLTRLIGNNVLVLTTTFCAVIYSLCQFFEEETNSIYCPAGVHPRKPWTMQLFSIDIKMKIKPYVVSGQLDNNVINICSAEDTHVKVFDNI